ncbi:uncharacterized protein BO97DRAFT_402437 [Aspergillus homomorphus CBS 101889]|uniref:Secreted protein n=1 Tax=Aspergillus homomorphus (strain CBS 101889) TaxID=1450537 RepID=A0A395IF60_ASPHC|nr:hypothetical protein BO97DRAFT_402437 [Aspergillus homomorphus CBS 101889]RAL16814.1 hypothetical protein BO97DRAFT_402437 [Aspergillus homomorphus CBS 101889]
MAKETSLPHRLVVICLLLVYLLICRSGQRRDRPRMSHLRNGSIRYRSRPYSTYCTLTRLVYTKTIPHLLDPSS